MVEKHEGTEERVHTFDQAWEGLRAAGPQELTTTQGRVFVAKATIITVGSRKGQRIILGKRRDQRVILYSRDGRECGRCYECCWEYSTNCKGTRLGEYSRAIDAWTGSTAATARLTRDELLDLIEENGGPTGLDLTGKDLGRLNIGMQWLADELEERGLAGADKLPPWVYWDAVTQSPMGVNLEGAILKAARIAYADLEGACLRVADLEGANLYHAKLQGAILVRANLQHARFEGADLQRAEMMEANLREASLVQANLQHAALTWANLQGARLEHASLQDVDLLDVSNLQGYTSFGRDWRGPT